MTTTLTVLHPGSMGAAVAAQAITSGHEVLWVAEGRSQATQRRAHAAGLTASSMTEALSASDVVLSICPAHAAEDIARAVADHAFTGAYVEANAISPQRTAHIVSGIRPAPTVLDGSIIGPPPDGQHTTRLYLAGDEDTVKLVANVFTGTAVQVRAAGERIGAASALKMAFAAFQRSARALAAVSHALADTHGVTDLLLDEAGRMPADALTDVGYLPSVAARAWRWVPELHEVAATLQEAGLPRELADATAAVMTRWEGEKNNYDLDPAEVLARLQSEP